MMLIRAVAVVLTLLVYSGIFSVQYHKAQELENSLDTALPVAFHKITAGYLKQLAAEMLFIKTSVFLGGVRAGTPPKSYEAALGNNFEVMTQLYPRFIDPYYFCQGFLTPISQYSAARANRIFETGISAHPDNQFIRMFQGTNYVLSLNEPLKAAKVFREASEIENASPLFGHLAALLSAKGGDIAAGLISLKAMLAAEDNEAVQNRYKEEIVIFEKALEVQRAIDVYTNKNGEPPRTLNQLVPEFITQLPVIKKSFILVYNAPDLHLQRPDKNNLVFQ